MTDTLEKFADEIANAVKEMILKNGVEDGSEIRIQINDRRKKSESDSRHVGDEEMKTIKEHTSQLQYDLTSLDVKR